MELQTSAPVAAAGTAAHGMDQRMIDVYGSTSDDVKGKPMDTMIGGPKFKMLYASTVLGAIVLFITSFVSAARTWGDPGFRQHLRTRRRA